MTAPITPDERAAMRRLALTTPQTPGEHAYVEHVPRLLDALDTAEAERDEVARLRAAPVWDEDTVTEAVRRSLESLWGAPEGAPRVYRSEAVAVLAVVREHLPVRPDRETIARAIHSAHRPITGPTPSWHDEAPAWRQTYLDFADAVLALWPGESRTTVQAEALRDAIEHVDEASVDAYCANGVVTWLRARADRLTGEGGQR